MFNLQIFISICFLFVKYYQAYNVNSGWRSWNSRILALPQSNTLSTNSFLVQQPSLPFPFPNLRSENSTESLIQIIRLGEQWLSRSPLYDVNINQLSDEYVTVFGCLANVKLKARIDQESRKVIVTGIADSKVALGMLAYIAEVIQSVIIHSHVRHATVVGNQNLHGKRGLGIKSREISKRSWNRTISSHWEVKRLYQHTENYPTISQ